MTSSRSTPLLQIPLTPSFVNAELHSYRPGSFATVAHALPHSKGGCCGRWRYRRGCVETSRNCGLSCADVAPLARLPLSLPAFCFSRLKVFPAESLDCGLLSLFPRFTFYARWRFVFALLRSSLYVCVRFRGCWELAVVLLVNNDRLNWSGIK